MVLLWVNVSRLTGMEQGDGIPMIEKLLARRRGRY